MMRKWTFGGMAALTMLFAVPAVAVTIELSAGEVADGEVAVDVVLRSEGETVGGMQNDILFDNTLLGLAEADCRINSALGAFPIGFPPDNLTCNDDVSIGPCKTLSRNLVNCGDSPSAPGCDGQPANISRFRGIMAATGTPNNNEIPDGSVLYTCTFDVVSTPADLTNTNVVASDPFGTRLDATGTDTTVGGGVDPTPTPTEDTQPTATPTEAPAGCTEDVCVNIGSAEPVEGSATIDIVLVGENVGGMQNDILFDNTILGLAEADCRINPALGGFPLGFPPDNLTCNDDVSIGPCKTLSRNLVNCGDNPSAPGCDGQPSTVSRFRGIIAATGTPNNNVIPSGSILYTCEFDVLDADGLTTILTNTNIVASDPFGARLEAGGDNGAVLGDIVAPTPTPTEPAGDTPTPTEVPTEEPTEVPTETPVPTATNTVPPVPTDTPVPPATATATATQGIPDGFDDDDGCNIAANGSSNSRGWLLLIPAFGLIALRRRRA